MTNLTHVGDETLWVVNQVGWHSRNKEGYTAGEVWAILIRLHSWSPNFDTTRRALASGRRRMYYLDYFILLLSYRPAKLSHAERWRPFLGTLMGSAALGPGAAILVPWCRAVRESCGASLSPLPASHCPRLWPVTWMENGEAGEPHDLLRVGAKNFHVPGWPRSPAPLQAALQVTEGKCGSLWLMVLSRFCTW